MNKKEFKVLSEQNKNIADELIQILKFMNERNKYPKHQGPTKEFWNDIGKGILYFLTLAGIGLIFLFA